MAIIGILDTTLLLDASKVGADAAKALETAKKLAEKPPRALALSKALLKDSALVKERMGKEGALFIEQLASPEVAEAITAFFEKRKPNFG